LGLVGNKRRAVAGVGGEGEKVLEALGKRMRMLDGAHLGFVGFSSVLNAASPVAGGSGGFAAAAAAAHALRRSLDSAKHLEVGPSECAAIAILISMKA
jgi:hypothetical protein